MKKRIIDVSQWQGVIDWNKVKDEVDGVIIRCGYGSDLKSQDDTFFERNSSECERLCIPYGVYLYSYATNESKAKSEAAHILRLVKGKKLSYPIYLDCEEEKEGTREYAKTACNIIGKIIENEGYKFGVYANLNWWRNYLVGVDEYTKWVAQYNSRCTYDKQYDMWQYSSTGSVPGIKGNVDMNECYKDFSKSTNKHESTQTINSSNNNKISYKLSTLKLNSKGNDVTIFETIMKKIGLYEGSIDNVFGNCCLTACNEFQKKFPECGTNGKPDGTFGTKSWNKLLSLLK